jgi:hypothetical protein
MIEMYSIIIMQFLRNDWFVSKWQAVMSSSLSHNFPGARTPRSAGRIVCGPPLVTLSTSFTLSFSQFVLLALTAEAYHTHFNRCSSCCYGYLVGQKTCSIGQKWAGSASKVTCCWFGSSVHLFKEYPMIFQCLMKPERESDHTLNPGPRSICIYLPLYASRPFLRRSGKFNNEAGPLFRFVKKRLDSVFKSILISYRPLAR